MKKNTTEIQEQTAYKGVLVCLFGLLLSILAASTSNSIVLIGDLLNSILEFLSISVSYLTYKAIKKSITSKYNYGLGKIENISSMIIGLFIILSILIMTFLIYYRFNNPTNISGFGIWVGIVCTFIFGLLNGKLFLKSYQQKKIKSSQIIDTQCRLFAIKSTANLLMFFSFIIGLGLQQFNFVKYIDPAVSIIITSFLIFNAYKILTHSIKYLLDNSIEEPLQLIIDKYLANYFNDYSMFYGVRSRYSGRKIFIEIFLEFAPEKTMNTIQNFINNISKDIQTEIPDSQVLIIPTNINPFNE